MIAQDLASVETLDADFSAPDWSHKHAFILGQRHTYQTILRYLAFMDRNDG